MALTTATIKTKLAAVSEKDDEARNIINGATTADLASLDAEGVLRLYEALVLLPPRWYSSDDEAALTRLKTNTQFQPVTNMPDYGVDLIKNAGKTVNQTLLTPDHVTRIYVAEKKRLSWAERHGFDGDTVGRGQLGQPAYTDVKSSRYFQTALETAATRVFLAKILEDAPATTTNYHFDFSTYKVVVPKNYSGVWVYPALEDVVVAGYLAIKIGAATKAGRSNKDVLRFAVAVYHGMFKMVSAAQTAVGDTINWAPVEAELKKQGNTDEVAYVNEVVI
jgi:hypothetical protein